MSLVDKMQRVLRIDRAVALVWQSAPGWTVAGVLLLVLQGAFPLLSLYLMKLVVDAVAAGMAAPDKAVACGQVVLFVGLAGLVALVSRLCQSLSGIVSAHQAQMVADHVSDVLHAKSIEMDLEYYENPQYFNSLHRAQQEAAFRPSNIVSGLTEVGTSGLTLVVMVGLLSIFHWAIAVVLFVSVIPGLIVRLAYADKMFRWNRSRTSTERRAQYLNWLLTGEHHAKELRLFGLGPLFMSRF
ncbi:MAG: ABC transporter ATP-binding protein, partial [Planctomycetes bacterium]|nr:ABC transporter ATP-binding protein [Planctomycetota bacterium]